MMKKFILKIVTIAVLVMGVLGSCTQDFTADFDSLSDKIAHLQETVDNLQNAIDKGLVITSVDPVDDGIKITFSDESEYTIINGKDGVNGTNGTDGKDGTIWKIGDNGNWWSSTNGEPFIDTDMPARGPQGLPGVNGLDGEDGKDGLDGKDGEDGLNGDYFYPCTDKKSTNYGKWIKVNGETGEETVTDDMWLPEGTITAIWADDTLTLHNVEGVDGPLAINLTHILKSLAVVPEQLVFGFAYPVVDAYALITEDEDADFPVSVFNIKYRVNPEGADMSEYEYHMIDRSVVVTKATADNRDNLIPKVVVTYDGKDELDVKGYIDYTKYAEPATETPRMQGRKTTVSIFALEAAKDAKGKEAVVSDYAAIRMDYVMPEWTAYSRYYPDATVEDWNVAPCEDNDWTITVDDTEVTKYRENDAIQVQNTYDVASRMRFADPWAGSLEALGFTVEYTYEIYKDFGVADKVDVTAEGIASVKEEYRTGEGLAAVIGQKFMVTAKATVVNEAGGKDAVFEAQYILLIVPNDTEAVNVAYDLGTFNYSKIGETSVNALFAPIAEKLMTLDGFTNIYTNEPKVTSTEPVGFEYDYNFGDENIFTVDITPLVKIGKDEVTFSFVPNSEEYPVLNYTVTYEVVFDVVAPILNPDYVLYDDEEKTILTKTVITPNPGVDSLVSVKGKEVDGVYKQQSSIKEHILDYGQYLTPAQPNISKLTMKINFEKSQQPEGSAEIFSNSDESDLYKYQEIKLTSAFAGDELYRDYVVDMYITLLNGEEYMIKEYIVRFIKPFKIIADDIVLETHKIDECIVKAEYKIVEVQSGEVLYDSATDEITDFAYQYFPGIFEHKITSPVWTLFADESFGDNLVCEKNTGIFTWMNDGGDLQVDKKAYYEISQTFSDFATIVGRGNITVLSTENSQPSHPKNPIIIVDEPIVK